MLQENDNSTTRERSANDIERERSATHTRATRRQLARALHTSQKAAQSLQAALQQVLAGATLMRDATFQRHSHSFETADAMS